MPLFKLFTNVCGSKVTPAALKELSEALAKTLAKPESVSGNIPTLHHITPCIIYIYFSMSNYVYVMYIKHVNMYKIICPLLLSKYIVFCVFHPCCMRV